jgi:hypothetical protein
MGWQSSIHGIHEKCTECISEDLKGRGHLEDISIIWRVILKHLEEMGSWDMDKIHVAQDSGNRQTREHGNEP